jgi:hypothetical protein
MGLLPTQMSWCCSAWRTERSPEEGVCTPRNPRQRGEAPTTEREEGETLPRIRMRFFALYFRTVGTVGRRRAAPHHRAQWTTVTG